ncbi:MAG TPA: hypothetical protein VJX67_22145 [Blastocatellia bacterium]|nr:hypothetical protein [Blastocatellia bacterium]
MLTQIYEVSTPLEARSISMIGVDHIGILVGTGEFPRELSVERAAEVSAEILSHVRLSIGNRQTPFEFFARIATLGPLQRMWSVKKAVEKFPSALEFALRVLNHHGAPYDRNQRKALLRFARDKARSVCACSRAICHLLHCGLLR